MDYPGLRAGDRGRHGGDGWPRRKAKSRDSLWRAVSRATLEISELLRCSRTGGNRGIAGAALASCKGSAWGAAFHGEKAFLEVRASNLAALSDFTNTMGSLR